ncbi:MAG: hypothetical protein C0521_10610 [Xanthomonas sp.]|jgi:hypothetical protein|uniref:hypothetical protein n=1 Tax=Pseudoxanthomonas mexicana TaxID=128785 RepID=UPI0007826CE5|nr:hypothetical protein [Pseudoxanthomonas mexicana]MBA3930023.1 hypothetical protein [Xanthomonas sp.]
MNKLWYAAAGVAIVSLPAYAARPEVPAMPVAEQLPVEIVLAQQELAIDVPANGAATGAAVGGLLGALIGTAIDKAAVSNGEERAAELRNQLVDYPFNQRMEAALREKLPSEGLSPQPQISVCNAPAATGTQFPSIGCSVAPATGVLVIVPRYAIDAKFENMVVQVNAHLIDRETKSNGKPKVRNRLTYTYHFNFPIDAVDGEKSEQTAVRWAALGSAPLAMLLDTGVAQVTDMLAYDFSAEGRAERATPKKGSTAFNGRMFNGQHVRTGKDWVWSRMGKHSGDALHGYYPVSPDALRASVAAAATPAEASVVAEVGAAPTSTPEAPAADAVDATPAPVEAVDATQGGTP